LADEVLEILFTMGTAVPVMPLTVVVRLLAEEVLETVPTVLLVAATPFTVLVNVLPDNPIVWVVVAGAHAVPFQDNTWPLAAPVVVPNGDPFILDTTAAPRLPVTSPVTLAVNAVPATPFTVLSN
jgi:hypothetical protein